MKSLIDFDDDLLEEIKYKMGASKNVKDFVLNNNNYFVINDSVLNSVEIENDSSK